MSFLKRILGFLFAQFGYRLVKAPKHALLEHPDGLLDIRLDFVVYDHFAKIKDELFFIVQIGAFDGISFNDPVRHYFADPRFQGLLIEPQPEIFNRLQKSYKNYPQVILENAAITHEDQDVTLYTIDTTPPELPSWLEGCASLDKTVLQKYERRFPSVSNHIRAITVPGMTLNTLLQKHRFNKIDLLQIDVEGFDYEVIKMVDFDKWQPAIIRFERNHLSYTDREKCYELLMQHGYKIAIEGIDVLAYADTASLPSS